MKLLVSRWPSPLIRRSAPLDGALIPEDRCIRALFNGMWPSGGMTDAWSSHCSFCGILEEVEMSKHESLPHRLNHNLPMRYLVSTASEHFEAIENTDNHSHVVC